MNLRSLLWQLLAWGVFPAWLAAGAADWLCHRRSFIERTSGPHESFFHLALYVQIAVPIMLALWFEINATMLVLMAVCVIAHMITSWCDTVFAQPRRQIAPIEQHVHSWLDMLPLFALLIVVALHTDELLRPRWHLGLRTPSMAPALQVGIALALVAGLAMIIEELLRGLRASRLSANSPQA
jgi:hypothetical protein